MIFRKNVYTKVEEKYQKPIVQTFKKATIQPFEHYAIIYCLYLFTGVASASWK